MKRFFAFLLALLTTGLLSTFAGCTPEVTDKIPQEKEETNTMEQNTTETKQPSSNEVPKEPLDLQGYRIIIPNNATNRTVESLVAYELKEMLSELGYQVGVAEDNNDASICKEAILLGKTVATTEETPAGNKYSVSEKNGTVQISAGTYYGYCRAISDIKKKILDKDGFPRDISYTSTATVTNVERATEESVRVMYYNVFGFTWWNGPSGSSAPPIALRQALQRGLIEAYDPDVLGCQEYMTDTYYPTFHATLSQLGYTEISTSDGTRNHTPLFYKADRLDLVESGYMRYTYDHPEGAGKSITWGVFRVKETGKLFSVFNTHFIHDENTVRDEERAHNAGELLALMNSVVARHNGLPAFLGGDLNFWNVWKNYDTESSRKPYEALINGGVTLVSNISGVETNFWTSSKTSGYTNSYHGYFKYDADKRIYDVTKRNISSPYTLDHVFLGGNKNGVTVKRHFIIEDDLTLRASDHSPILIDFVLK